MQRFVVLVAVLIAAAAHAATEVDVLETFPAGNAVTLPPGQNFYLRLAYSTDDPVHIWARPYYRGKEVEAGSNPSPVYTGSGEALGWFFLMDGAKRVDEIRITAGDGSTAGTPVVATYAVDIRAGSGPDDASTQPAWVQELVDDSSRRMREGYDRMMAESTGAGGTLYFLLFMLAVLAIGIGGIAAPAWALWRWDGAWRFAAAVPALVVGFVVLRIVADTSRDPTSHNLWPFEVLQAGAVSLVLVGALALARRRLSGWGQSKS